MNLEIMCIKDLDADGKIKIDDFILDERTNGEFINTIKYLSYHPEDRFFDESIIIKDVDSGVIKCVMMAASTKENLDTIVSHPGTTFSGLIFDRKTKISEIDHMINMIETFYGQKHRRCIFKMPPSCYSSQLNEEINYTLLKNDYRYGYTALSNIIDLSKINNEDELFEIYNSKRRNQVRKPIKKNEYDFIKMDTIDESIWMNMNQNLKDKFNSKTTHTYLEIYELQNRFQNNIIPYVVKTKNQEYGAFALVYKFKNVFHTQYLDMNYDLSSEYPNLFLIHCLIKEAIKEEFRYFSFGASTENSGEYLNETLFSYKNGYGGGSILLPKFTKGL